MRRYYFDYVDGAGAVADEEGLLLPHMDAVQEEAARALAEFAKEEVSGGGGGPLRHMSIVVRDDDGPVLNANFSFEIKRLQ